MLAPPLCCKPPQARTKSCHTQKPRPLAESAQPASWPWVPAGRHESYTAATCSGPPAVRVSCASMPLSTKHSRSSMAFSQGSVTCLSTTAEKGPCTQEAGQAHTKQRSTAQRYNGGSAVKETGQQLPAMHLAAVHPVTSLGGCKHTPWVSASTPRCCAAASPSACWPPGQ